MAFRAFHPLYAAERCAPSRSVTPLITALQLAAHGLRVFPVHRVVDGRCMCGQPSCASISKHPRTKHRYLDATTEPHQIST
jgi:hypothetical protein